MNIILLGIQGAGKSTQGNLLSKRLGLPYLSTGHIFRHIAHEKTKLGRHIKEIINSGSLVPDALTIEIVNTYLSRPEYKKGFILDGFPRTLSQAKLFKFKITKVLYIEISEKEALWRLVMRKGEERNDNTIAAVHKRIEQFFKHTKPVLDYYKLQKLVVQLDGTQEPEVVNDEILKSLGKHMVGKKLQPWHLNKKIVVCVVSLPGAGKTEAVNYYSEMGFPVISFGKILNDYLQDKKLPQTERNHKKYRELWRKQKGMAAFAIMSEDRIKEMLAKNPLIIIDGMRSFEEYEYLQKNLVGVKLYIISIFADKSIRYARIKSRSYRSKLGGPERDMNELKVTNLGATFAYADYLIKNNFSKEELHDKLEETIRAIQYE